MRGKRTEVARRTKVKGNHLTLLTLCMDALGLHFSLTFYINGLQLHLLVDITNFVMFVIKVVFSFVGILYHRWGKLDLAETAYHKALQLEPTSQQVKENIQMLKKKKVKQ